MNNLSAALVLLSTFFCAFYPVRTYFKTSPQLIAAICLGYTGLTLPLLDLFWDATGMRDNRALFVFLIPFFGAYFFLTKLTFARCLLIYIWAAVFMTFPSNAAYIAAAMTGAGTRLYVGPDVFLIQAVLSLVICSGVYLSTSLWDVRVISPAHSFEGIWYSWLSIPVLFLAMNIAMIPASPNLLRARNLAGLYGLFTICLLLLYIYLTAIFYSFTLEYIHVREFEKAAHLHEIKNLQYKNLQEQMQRDSRVRHDFKHTLHVLTRLAAQENWKELKQYLSNYAEDADNIIVKNYCFNPALNAVLNYYAEKGAENGIATELQIDLPDELPIDDVEFCSLLGNIMENAIDACGHLPKEERRLAISVQLKNFIHLYIVSTNSYDGSLANSIGVFVSTKPGHTGIGLRSIRETVEKYHGTMRVDADEKEFRLDIVMKFEASEQNIGA
ncbi:MAG: sensor histidine kinase [Lachnospiraceae bacterium]|nr:sensor histidine kinase [Lachnospiraceae bacterium]